MKTLAAAVALIFFAYLPVAHSADGLNADDWKRACMGEDVPPSVKGPARAAQVQRDLAACMWYARGLADAIELWEYSGQRSIACIPSEVSTSQLRDVGLLFWKNNPKHRHEHMGIVLSKAFMEAWPCKNNPSRPQS